jgi:hypothetical protein
VIDYDTCQNFNELHVGLASDSEGAVGLPAPMQTFSYSQAGVIAVNTDLLIIDCTQLRSLLIQCTSMGTTGTMTMAWSNDGTNWVNTSVFTSGGTIAASMNAAGLWFTPVCGKYARLRLTIATTGGTTTLAVVGMTTDRQPWQETQPVSGTVTATVTGGTTLPVTPTQSFVNSAATTNATSTKASAGTVWSVLASNINAAVRYLKLYNKASAPTVGTDIPVMVIPIPAGGVVQINGGSNGLRFGTGIAWALTTGAADSNATAVAAGEIKVAIAYT